MTPALLPLIVVAWLAGWIAFGAWRRNRAGQPLVPRVPPGAAFGETGASGRLPRGLFGTLGGANRCLIVWVGQGRLVVTFAFPFTVFPVLGMRKLECDVPVAQIARVTPLRRLWQNALRIEFAGDARPPIELTLRNEAGFLAALEPALADPARRAAGRDLSARTGPRASAWIARGFLALWGTAFLAFSLFQLTEDIAVRGHGQPLTATVVAMRGKSPIVAWQVDGQGYTMVSQFDRGIWGAQQSETVYAMTGQPWRAVEAQAWLAHAMAALAGVIALVLAIFGRRLVPGWS